jgi:putative FmdB family regulatory protein
MEESPLLGDYLDNDVNRTVVLYYGYTLQGNDCIVKYTKVILMPVYEYKCGRCGEVFEKLIRNPSQIKNVTCSRCGSREINKLVSSFACSGTDRGESGDLSASSCSSCSLPSCSTCK